jgi:hypothetical protein
MRPSAIVLLRPASSVGAMNGPSRALHAEACSCQKKLSCEGAPREKTIQVEVCPGGR